MRKINYIFEIANLLSRSHHVMVFSNGIINNRRITKLLPHSFYYEELPTISINFMKPSLAVPRLPKWINHYEFAYIYHVGVMYSYLALRYLKIPKVLGIHSDILSNFSQWRYPRKVSLGAFKILFKYANGIRCGTNHYVRLLKNSLGINPKKIFVIPEHVNTDVFAPCQKKKHFTVLFAGRLINSSVNSYKMLGSKNRNFSVSFPFHDSCLLTPSSEGIASVSPNMEITFT